MEQENSVSLRVWGRKALFTDPRTTKFGEKKFSYSLPTYETLREILESCCGKPALRWVIDKVRILKPIRIQSEGMHSAGPGGGPLSICTYLADVAYQIKAHFEWNENCPELAEDRGENEHFFIAERMIERGGRWNVFLGARECQGYVEPCTFGEGEGAYDNLNEMDFGLMVHSVGYPDETGRDALEVRLWQPKMFFGVVTFPRPEDCTVVKPIREMRAKPFAPGANYSGCRDFCGTPAAEEEDGGKP